MLSRRTRHAIAIAWGLLFAGCASTSLAKNPEANLWSGTSGFKYDFSPVTPKSEIVGNGETLAIFYKAPVRTAKLLGEFRGTHDQVIPAGTPFIALAADRPSSADGKTPKAHADQNVMWCAASYMPTPFCFRLSRDNEIQISRAKQPTLFDVTPIND